MERGTAGERILFKNCPTIMPSIKGNIKFNLIVEEKQAQQYMLHDNKVFTLYFYNYYHSCEIEYSLVSKLTVPNA